MSISGIEELKVALNHARERNAFVEMADCYNAIAEKYRAQGDEVSVRQAIINHTNELRICESHNLTEGSIIANRFLGDCHRNLREYREAKHHYETSLALNRQDISVLDDDVEDRFYSSSVIAMEESFLTSCQNKGRLVEYYRGLCNLGLTYLDESFEEGDEGHDAASDFHVGYRSIPLFKRSYKCICAADKLLKAEHNRCIEEEKEDEWKREYYHLLIYKCEALMNIGLSYDESGSYKRSLEFYYQCLHMESTFRIYASDQSWESRISRSKHNIAICYMKMKDYRESEYYLKDDLLYCTQQRLQSSPSTSEYYAACLSEGQTHQSLGNLYLRRHLPNDYNVASQQYEQALRCYEGAGKHIASHYDEDVKKNQKVVEDVKTMRGEIERMKCEEKERESQSEWSEEERKRRREAWTEIMLMTMNIEMLMDEEVCSNMMKNNSQWSGEEQMKKGENVWSYHEGEKEEDFCYGKCLHLYSEYLYKLYCGEENEEKLNFATAMIKTAIQIYRHYKEETVLAECLELYATILSALHKPSTTQDEVSSYIEAASLFSRHLPECMNSYTTNLTNLIITYNRIGCFKKAKELRRELDQIWKTTDSESQDPVPLADLNHVRDVDLPATQEEEGTNADDFVFDEEDDEVVTTAIGTVVHEEKDSGEDSREGSGEDALFDYESSSEEMLEEATLSKEDLRIREKALQQEIEEHKKQPRRLMKLLMKLGDLYRRSNSVEKALEVFKSIMKRFLNDIENEDVYHYCCRVASEVYQNSGDTERSLRIMNDDVNLLLLRKKKGRREEEDYYNMELQRSYVELGNCYMNEFDGSSSLSSLHHAKHCYTTSLSYIHSYHYIIIMSVLINIANVEMEEGHLAEADRTYRKAIYMWRDPFATGDLQDIGVSLNDEGFIYGTISKAFYGLGVLWKNQGLFWKAWCMLMVSIQYNRNSRIQSDLVKSLDVMKVIYLLIKSRRREEGEVTSVETIACYSDTALESLCEKEYNLDAIMMSYAKEYKEDTIIELVKEKQHYMENGLRILQKDPCLVSDYMHCIALFGVDYNNYGSSQMVLQVYSTLSPLLSKEPSEKTVSICLNEEKISMKIAAVAKYCMIMNMKALCDQGMVDESINQLETMKSLIPSLESEVIQSALVHSLLNLSESLIIYYTYPCSTTKHVVDHAFPKPVTLSLIKRLISVYQSIQSALPHTTEATTLNESVAMLMKAIQSDEKVRRSEDMDENDWLMLRRIRSRDGLVENRNNPRHSEVRKRGRKEELTPRKRRKEGVIPSVREECLMIEEGNEWTNVEPAKSYRKEEADVIPTSRERMKEVEEREEARTIDVAVFYNGYEEKYCVEFHSYYTMNDITLRIQEVIEKTKGFRPQIMRIIQNDRILDTSTPSLPAFSPLCVYLASHHTTSLSSALQTVFKPKTQAFYSILGVLNNPENWKEKKEGHPMYYTIEHLPLSHLHLNDDAIYYLLQASQPSFTVLSDLSIANNMLTDVSASLLAISILHHALPSLQSIDLSYNFFHSYGLYHLLTALSMEYTSFRCLRLDGICLSMHYLTAVIRIIYTFPAISISMCFCNLQREGIGRIGNAIMQSQIRELDLEGNRLDEDYEFSLMDSIIRMKELEVLNLSNCNLSLHALDHFFQGCVSSSIRRVLFRGNNPKSFLTHSVFIQHIESFIEREKQIEIIDISGMDLVSNISTERNVIRLCLVG